MDYIKKYWITPLLLIAVLLVSYPIFSSGFFPIHDNTQIERVFEMSNSLRDGMLPARISQNLGYGYGYPIFNFYAPLVYYVGAVIAILGVNVLLATKIAVALGILLSGAFMYLLSKEFFGRYGGILSSVLYIFAPYHAVDIYVRGDFAEAYAYAFLPLSFYASYKLIKENKLIFFPIASLSYALVVLSHNLTALMLTPFLVTFILIIAITLKKASKLYVALGVVPLGLLISSFFWLPALAEMQMTNVLSQVGGGADFRNHFVCLGQLWQSQWGFGGSAPGCVDGMSFMIGKLHIIFSILSLISLLSYKTEKKNKVIIFFAGIILGTSVFFMLPISKLVWETVPLMEFVQYPWRFLIFASFSSSLLSGALFFYAKKSFIYIMPFVSVVLTMVVVYAYSEHFKPQHVMAVKDGFYENDQRIRWNTSKISDEFLPKNFIKPTQVEEVPDSKFSEVSNVEIISQQETTDKSSAQIISQDGVVRINSVHPDYWKVFLDGKEVIYRSTDRGFMVDVPKGNHLIELLYSSTFVQKLSNILSLGGFGILVVGIIFLEKRRIWQK